MPSKTKKQMVTRFTDTGWKYICGHCGVRHGSGPTGPRSLEFRRCSKHEGSGFSVNAALLAASNAENERRRKRHRQKALGTSDCQA